MNVQRFGFYILVNVLGPILVPFFRYFKIFDFVVLVYPGNKNNVTTYLPFAWLRRLMPMLSIVGFIQKGDQENGKRGIIIASKYYIEEMYGKKTKVAKAIERLARRLGAQKVALVGRLPKILFDYGSPLFVDGKKGTVFSVIDTLEIILSRLRITKKDITVGVIGVGVIGNEVVKVLKGMGFGGIVAVDKKLGPAVTQEGVTMGSEATLLATSDIVIVLTSRGDDIEGAIGHLKNSVILLDDTYPFISKKNIVRIQQEKRGKIYKVAAVCKGMLTFPKIPGFYRDWIPGCVVEAVVSLHGKDVFVDQAEFNEAARESGMHTIFSEISEDNLR